jgi:type IV pilus assembly protein PilY1
VAQPISAKPLLTEIAVSGGAAALVAFGTGRYLGDTDLSNADRQSIYVIKDALLGTDGGNFRDAASNLVALDLVTDGTGNRVLNGTPTIDWTSKNGWYVDLDQSDRERIYLDATPVGSGVIAFASVIPNGDPCSAGGSSWVYEFNLERATLLQATSYNSAIVGIGRVVDSSGPRTLVTTVGGLDKSTNRIPGGSLPPGSVKRTSWRELLD